MRIIGWILRTLGCVWAIFGSIRIFLAVVGAVPGPGKNFVAGLITLALAALAIWGSGKLLDKVDKAKALKTIN